MATSRKDMQDKNLTFRRFEDGDHKWDSMHEKIFVEDTSHKCPTYVHRHTTLSGKLSFR